PGAGAVYVFTRQGTAWTQQAYVKASNAGGYFGISVALSGDTLAVGAPNEKSAATGINGDQSDVSLTAAGAAYVFVRTNAIWTQQAYLKASNTGEFDDFGRSVALSDDTLAVGGAQEASASKGVDPANGQLDDSAPGAGAVYVFVRASASWSQQAYLKASNTDRDDQFGWSVALRGDTLVVGAQGDASRATGIDGDQVDNSALVAGAAYVFARGEGVWTQRAYVKASNTGSKDQFGAAVAVSHDVVAVGAWPEASQASGINPDGQSDNSARLAGAVYLFR
ncbi:MAG TPA: integrin, partial [Kofleriaceae bacterium]|nr:integrin [Kofleriaceae bacterium]